jgi:hypothetical protein
MTSLCEELDALPNPGTVWVGPFPGYATTCRVNHPMVQHNWWYRCGLSTNGSRLQPSRTLIDDVTRCVHAIADVSRYRERGAVALRAAKLTRQIDIQIIAGTSGLQTNPSISRRNRGCPAGAVAVRR